MWHILYGYMWHILYGDMWHILYGDMWHILYGGMWYILYGDINISIVLNQVLLVRSENAILKDDNIG